MANLPHPQHPDLEDLVAFLEGRGSEAVRALVLKRLDEDPDYLATMNDLVPMLREAGLIPEGGIAPASPEPTESEPKTKVIGDASRFRRRTGLIAIAAALVPIGVGLWLSMGSNVRLPVRLMPSKLGSAQLQAWNSILANETWVDTSKNTRGSERSSGGEISSLPLIGAQIFDLEVAVWAQDRELAKKRLQVLQSTLGDKKSTTYGGLPWPKDGEGWTGVETEMAKAYEWLAKPEVFAPEDLKQIERGACLRAAWLAEKAQNPDFFKSWDESCRDVVDPSTWQDEVKELQQQLFELDDEDPLLAPPG